MQSGASSRFERKYVRPRPGRTIIVGSRIYGGKPDRRDLYEDALGADMQDGEGVDLVLDLEEPLPHELVGQFAHVECISVLEHSRRPWRMAANIERLLQPGGTLHVQAPFVWRQHGYPSDYWRFTLEGVRELFPGIDWRQLTYASKWLSPKPKVPRVQGRDDGETYFGRCEVCGFGERR